MLAKLKANVCPMYVTTMVYAVRALPVVHMRREYFCNTLESALVQVQSLLKSLDSEAGDNCQLNWCPLFTSGMLVVMTVRSSTRGRKQAQWSSNGRVIW